MVTACIQQQGALHWNSAGALRTVRVLIQTEEETSSLRYSE